MLNFYVIYKLTSPSGKFYIGQTKNLAHRFSTYRNLHLTRQPNLCNSIKKYGWESFRVELLYNGICTKEEIDLLEESLISKYWCDDILNDSKLANGFTWKTGKENKTSKRVFQYDRKGNLLKEWASASDISRATELDGRYVSYRCYTENHYAYGYYWSYTDDSEKIKDYIESLKKKPKINSKKVVQLTMDGEYIKIWESATEAAKFYEIRPSSISAVTTGSKSSGKGFRWVKELAYKSGEYYLRPIGGTWKPIIAISLIDGKRTEYKSIREASDKLDIGRSAIMRILKNTTINPRKYDFKYK